MWQSAMLDSRAVHVAPNSADCCDGDFAWQELVVDGRALEALEPEAALREVRKQLEALTGHRPITAVYVGGEELTADAIGDDPEEAVKAGSYVIVCTGDEYDAEKWDPHVKNNVVLTDACCSE
eukprot:CAMPEP_0168489730 /NCGR_PEP_ID=MMETSP0228-20121227/68817_1 /TAXON_ID=133427 /ORGANISM="Protoceratium reticulatum, Strain CCCM 535 (=CCMP 1889)" /LENGTH=122 /DNA_ID=CAMNT_0008506417 /DNA_START=21 /DNA_END=387 /DNA_ORIENTATION=+